MTKPPSASQLQLSLAFLIAASAVLGVQSARADAVPPDEEACQFATEGDACGDGGKCQSAKCYRLDYEHWDRDASAGPPSVEYDCLKCSDEPGEDPDEVDAGEHHPRVDPPDAAVVTPPSNVDAGPTSGSTGDGDKDTTKSGSSADGKDSSKSGSSSSCSVSYRRLARGFGPWLLAGSVALFVSRRRRVS